MALQEAIVQEWRKVKMGESPPHSGRQLPNKKGSGTQPQEGFSMLNTLGGLQTANRMVPTVKPC